jgi:hypothetical protein
MRNIIARGKGTSMINGHPESWLENISLENVKLFLSADPEWPLQKAVHAMKLRWARDVKLKDIEVIWDKPQSEKWESALYIEDTQGLDIDGFTGRPARPGSEVPAVVLETVEDAVVRNARVREGTTVFVGVRGNKSRGIILHTNDLRHVTVPYQLEKGAMSTSVKAANNFTVER